jgi:hypothetical protein
MLPQMPPVNDSVDSKASEEKRNEIFNKIAVALETSTVKPISDKIVTKIITDFTSSLQETNKDLLETLLDEDKKLLKETVDAISKLQGKNSKELDRLLLLAEKLILSGQTNKNEKMQGIGERLKESVLKGKPETDSSGRTLLSGDQDTMKNRFIRSMTGITPEQAKVQGTSVLGYLGKTSSRAFREGMGSLFVSDKERSGDVARKSEQENKQISLAQQTASELYKILDSSGPPKNNTNSPDNSATESNGEEVTTNLSNPAASIDTVTRSDAQELAAGIRDTDSTFSRSSTLTNDPWEQRWKDLLDLMNKIKDCVCSCQCTDQQGPMDVDLPDGRRNPGQRQPRQMRGRGRIGTAIKVGIGALAAGAAGAVAYGSGALSGAYDYVKEKVGFGSKKPGVSTPESMPRTNPNAPATEVTKPRPGAVDTRAPRSLPTPANDPGVKIPQPANENDRFVEEQKKRVNQRQQPQGPTEKSAPKQLGTVEPANKPRTAPGTPANDVPNKPNKPTATKGGFFSRAFDKAKSFVSGSKVSKILKSPAAKAAGGVVGRLVAPVMMTYEIMSGIDDFMKKTYSKEDKTRTGLEKYGMKAVKNKQGMTEGYVLPDGKTYKADKLPPKYKDILDAYGPNNRGGTSDAARKRIEANPSAYAPDAMAKKSATVSPAAVVTKSATVSPAAANTMSPSIKTTAGLESGRNLDSTYIEKGTAATKDKLQINVPPPTVIQAPSKSAEGGQQIISGGNRDRLNARSADSSWLRFQEKRAVA